MKSIAAILALASSAAAFAPQTQSTVSQVTMTNSGSNGGPHWCQRSERIGGIHVSVERSWT
jgi:hypothetical protein